MRRVAAATPRQARGFSSRFWEQQFRRHNYWHVDPEKAVWGILGANVAGFLAWSVAPHFMARHAVLSVENLESGRLWTLLTYSVATPNTTRLFGNCVTLYFFGRSVAAFGGRTLLKLYAAGALAGAICHLGYYRYKAYVEGSAGGARMQQALFRLAPPAAGATAAVDGIMMCSIAAFPKSMIYLYAIIPVPAALFGLLWIVSDLAGYVQGSGRASYALHTGGMIAGLLFFRTLRMPRLW